MSQPHYVSLEDLNVDNFVVGEIKKNKLPKGHWYGIQVDYIFPDEKLDQIRIFMPDIIISGIREQRNEEDPKKVKYSIQYPARGSLDKKIVKKLDQIRGKIGELVIAKYSDLDHLEGLDPKRPKDNRLLYWKKKDEELYRFYLNLGYNATFYIPNPNTKEKVSVLPRTKILENFDKKISYELTVDLIWKVKYVYISANGMSIITEVEQALVKKIAPRGITPLLGDIAMRKMEENPEIVKELEEQLSEIAVEHSDEESSAPKTKSSSSKTKTSKAKGFEKFMDGSDEEKNAGSDEETFTKVKSKKSKKGKGKAKDSDAESDE